MTRMSARRLGLVGLLAAFAWLPVFPSAVAADPAAIEKLFPSDTVFVWSCNGSDSYAEAYKQTAEYAAVHDTGLAPALENLWRSIPWQTGMALATSDGDAAQMLEAFNDADVTWDPLGWLNHLYHHGAAIGVTLPQEEDGFIPTVILVIRDAGDSVGDITKLLTKAAEGNAEITEKKLGDRTLQTVRSPEQPLVAAWWAEGDDLVLLLGPDAVTRLEARLESQTKSLAAVELWTKAWGTSPQGFSEAGRIWLNVAPVLDRFGKHKLPIPETPIPITANWIVKLIGLESFQAVGHRSGYAGRSAVGLTTVLTKSPRTGLFNLYGDRELTLKDLPPLPAQLSALQASSLSPQKITDFGKTLWGQVESIAKEADADAWSQVEEFIPQIDGGIWQSVIDPLGDVMCVYGDNAQVAIPWGQQTIAISVKDAPKLKAGIDSLLKEVRDSKIGPFVTVTRKTKHGVELITLRAKNSMSSPTLAVSEGWLIWADRPQVVEAFVLRQQGKLPRFKLDQLAEETRKSIPEKFDAITLDDPRGTVRFLVSLAPWLVDIGAFGSEMALQFGIPWQSPVTSADIPPAELVIQPLYQGVTIVEIEEDAIRMTRKASTLIPETALWTIGGVGVLVLLGAFGVSVN